MAPSNQVTKDFALARINLVVGADAIVKRLRGKTPLTLIRAPNDQFDPNSVAVFVVSEHGNRRIGYLPPGLAKEIAPLMDAGVKVIAQKAPNPLYGVCQLAYIPPEPAPAEEAAPVVEEAIPEPVAPPPAIELPEGVTQQDLDDATDLPPLGDSRRPRQQEDDSDDEPSSEPNQ